MEYGLSGVRDQLARGVLPGGMAENKMCLLGEETVEVLLKTNDFTAVGEVEV